MCQQTVAVSTLPTSRLSRFSLEIVHQTLYALTAEKRRWNRMLSNSAKAWIYIWKTKSKLKSNTNIAAEWLTSVVLSIQTTASSRIEHNLPYPFHFSFLPTIISHLPTFITICHERCSSQNWCLLKAESCHRNILIRFRHTLASTGSEDDFVFLPVDRCQVNFLPLRNFWPISVCQLFCLWVKEWNLAITFLMCVV